MVSSRHRACRPAQPSPDVFIAEIDAVYDGEDDGEDGVTTVSLVQIFRIRDGKIARLRDYFAPELMS